MLDTLILYAILTAATIPFAIALRWYVNRDPEAKAAFQELSAAKDDVVTAFGNALGITWLLDRLASFIDRFQRR